MERYDLKILFVREGIDSRSSSRELEQSTRSLMVPFRCFFVVANNFFIAMEQIGLHDFDVIVLQTKFHSDNFDVLNFDRLLRHAADDIPPMVLLQSPGSAVPSYVLKNLRTLHAVQVESPSRELFLTSLCSKMKRLFYQSHGIPDRAIPVASTETGTSSRWGTASARINETSNYFPAPLEGNSENASKAGAVKKRTRKRKREMAEDPHLKMDDTVGVPALPPAEMTQEQTQPQQFSDDTAAGGETTFFDPPLQLEGSFHDDFFDNFQWDDLFSDAPPDFDDCGTNGGVQANK